MVDVRNQSHILDMVIMLGKSFLNRSVSLVLARLLEERHPPGLALLDHNLDSLVLLFKGDAPLSRDQHLSRRNPTRGRRNKCPLWFYPSARTSLNFNRL
jgi:hypothetical protein